MPSGQETRRIAFEFRAGPYTSEELTVLGFSGREELSRAFSFTVELAAVGQAAIQPREMLGQKGVLALHDVVNGASRFVHGIIGRVESLGERQGLMRYRALLVPEFWKLRHVRRSRIFQQKSVPEIVQQVLEEAGLSHGGSLDGSYAPRDFCVQYRESDFDFVSRLLESEGIFFFFEHTEDAHTLMLGDGTGAHTPIPGEARLPFRGALGTEVSEEHVLGLERVARVQPGAVVLRDFDFVRPSLDLTANKEASNVGTELEVYDYPGKYEDPGAGKNLSKVRLEEHRQDAERCEGESSSVRMVPGCTFTLTEHPDAAFEGDYLLVAVEHSGGHHAYRSRFHALPAAVPFRPPRLTPAPVIAGAQTAIVVGPSGEEIHTDEHGRIKVRFHWDREAPGDDRSSCWIRVSQAWAGAGWGALYLPRIGQEVIVRFLEGDPDRPLVVGSVYNGENPPPVPLPDEKTKSTLRSSSSPGGGGFNELRFEDAAGTEFIALHGQKDWEIQAENDKTQRIGGFEDLTVAGNRTQSVQGNQILAVQQEDVRKIQGNQSLTVMGNRTTDISGDHHEDVANAQSITVAQVLKLDVAMASMENVAAAKALTVGGAYSVAVGLGFNEAVIGLKAEQVGGSFIEVVQLDREEKVDGDRSSKIFGEFKTAIPEELKVEIGKDLTETVKGDTLHAITGGFAWMAQEIELKADKLTVSVGGKVVLTVEQSGNIQWTGSSITVDGSQLKFKGSEVKRISAGSQKSLKGKKGKAPKAPKKDPVPVLKSLTWDKNKAVPNHNSGAPPGGAVPADAKIVAQVETENVPAGARALISIHHCLTGARVGALTDLVVQGNKVVDKKTGQPPVWTFEAKHLPWDPYDCPHFFFRVKLSHKGLTGSSPYDLGKDKAKTLQVEYWHMVVSDSVADTGPGGGLTTGAEMNEIAGLIRAKAHHKAGTLALSGATVPVANWGSLLRNTYSYHHASHGDVQDPGTGASLQDPKNNNPPHSQPGGNWRSVIVAVASSNQPGNTFGEADVRNKTAVPSVPRYLVYVDTCVAGWERSLGNAFVNRGTRNYLAFRCYIPDNDARAMARNFYTKWRDSYHFNPAKIPAVFYDTGAPYYHSMRPVLFGEGGGSIDHPFLQPFTALGRAIAGFVTSVVSMLK
ncbi:type VI secretion system Vgr family protein [Hyalangium minutum]|uniref:VgrG protein n=1 Tax=Hyalangium minutum TaxID=394096 RepID=A0A085WSA7_9BACT|nr:type VI secretion system tip protein VgrG [Hyalangium minutum]KFE70570.1 VgrG protein [Hyalangium minutum]